MSNRGVTSEFLQTRGKVKFEWRIRDFLSLSEQNKDVHKSPVFSFMDSLWYFELFPNGDTTPGWISVYLTREDSGPPINVNHTLKNKNLILGFNLSWSGSHTYENDDRSYGWTQFIKRSVLLEQKSVLFPTGVLTFKCCLEAAESNIAIRPRPIILPELNSLSVELGKLLKLGTNSDVTLNVQNKKFRAHRSILIARSEVLAKMFEHELSESKTGVVDIVDCDPDSFEDFLHYLYTGKVEEANVSKILHLYKTADKYAVLNLKSMCVEFMECHLSANNVCAVATLAHRHSEEQLLAKAQSFFNKNLTEVLSTDSWDALVSEEYILSKNLLKTMASKVKIEN